MKSISRSLLICLFSLSCCMFENFAFARSKDWGIGVIIGGPAALTAKHILSSKAALDFGLGYNWNNSMQIYSDYLFVFPGAFSTVERPGKDISPYLGLGGALSLYHSNHKPSIRGKDDVDMALAIRVPLGLSWMISETPVELFIELAPILDFIPGLYVEVSGGLGARVYF